VTLTQCQAEMTALADGLRKENPAFGDWGVVIRGLRADFLGEWPDARSVPLLQGAVALVLLIACANVATMLLARAASRRREIAIRLAVGGGRWRIVRQLLAESLLLAAIGGAAGVLLAGFGLDAANAWLRGQDLLVWTEVSLDATALAFSLGLSVATGVGFGLVPAWQATRPDVQAALRGTNANTTAGVAHRRLLDTLTVAEIALALVLLVGAGLFVRTLTQLRRTPPGFAPTSVLAVQTSLTETRYATNAQRDQFVAAALERLGALPGVGAAAAIDVVPMGGGASWDLYIVGRPRNQDSSWGGAETRRISPDYFCTMGVPLRRGRVFSTADAAGAPAVAIVNEAIVRRYFPDIDPVGQQIELGDGIANPKTIVGVVPDERVAGITAAAPLIVYVPLTQGWFKGASTSYPVNFIVRAAGEPRGLAKPIQRALRELNPDLAFAAVRPMTWFVGASIRGEFMRSGMLAVFSAIALLLAALGIYGVVANAVSQRTNEFGVRLALGAEPADILRLVLQRSAWLIAFGTAIGLGGALAGTRLLRSFLHGVSPTDPFTFAATALFVGLVAGFAAWLPARRATRVNPVDALRAE
jgi:predicted permease